jgi:hypothetical protein
MVRASTCATDMRPITNSVDVETGRASRDKLADDTFGNVRGFMACIAHGLRTGSEQPGAQQFPGSAAARRRGPCQ